MTRGERARDARRIGPRQLLGALKAGRISRREFIIRAAAFGFSAAAINAFLIACGNASGGNPLIGTATTGAGSLATGVATTIGGGQAGTAIPTFPATTTVSTAPGGIGGANIPSRTATRIGPGASPAAGATATRTASPAASPTR